MERWLSLRTICHLLSRVFYFLIVGQLAVGFVGANEINAYQLKDKKTIKIGVVRLEDPFFISTASVRQWNISEKNIKTGTFKQKKSQ